MLSNFFGNVGPTTQVAIIAASTVVTAVFMVTRARVKRDKLKMNHERRTSESGQLAKKLYDVVKGAL